VNPQFERMDRQLRPPAPVPPAPVPPAPVQVGRYLRMEERLEQVPFNGWSGSDPDLENWLERIFSERPLPNDETSWHALVATAAERPLGIYEHPHMIGPLGMSGNSLEYARRMTVALLARGLQLQSRGDPAAFISAFRTTLKLAQTMENGSVVTCLQMGCDIESSALRALDRWMEYRPPPIEWLRIAAAPMPSALANLPAIAYEMDTVAQKITLFRALIACLTACDPMVPFDPTPQYLAERHVIREALKAPSLWLPLILSLPPETFGTPDPIVDMVTVAWTVPWEKERTRRLVGLGYESGRTVNHSLMLGRPGAMQIIRNKTSTDLAEVDRQLRTYRRGAILKLALMTFRCEQGKYPSELGELVSKGYLRQSLPDPYDDTREFGYRVSTGEKLRFQTISQGERMPITQVPDELVVSPGQAIIWSVGSDRIDQGGINPPGPIAHIPGRPVDIVFLVPLWPNQ
jgi:hypothetical protein